MSGGHNTAPPSSATYSSVVTRESVRMAFLIYGMNNLDICSCGIGYAYLNAPCQEKMWTKSGSESGSDKGYLFLNLRDIYGPKSSGKAWRAKLAETLDSISYRHTESYPNF